MDCLKIITAPNTLLQQKSLPVERITNETQNFCKQMLKTMYKSGGIGLAAVQVGVLKRIIVVDVSWPEQDEPSEEQYIMINPQIVESSKKKNTYKEGCLSFPNEAINITRPEEVTVNYLDISGKQNTLHASGLLATCIQHEIDHLNGVTIGSYVSPLKKQMMLKRLKKLKKQ